VPGGRRVPFIVRKTAMRRSATHGSTQEWRAIADRSPDLLYQVIAWPEKKGTWTEEDFYDLGRADWADFRARWLAYSPDLGGTCLEVGCGPGRMTAALAGDFDRVIALDVAQEMLDRAGRQVPSNVELRLVDGPVLPVDSGSCDAAFSVHVFQHMDGAEAVAANLGEVYRALRPGGTIMIHINLAGRSDRELGLRDRLRARYRRRRNLRAVVRGATNSYVTTKYYQPHQVWPVLHTLGFADIELLLFSAGPTGYPHSFWFARKPNDAST
jgi:SAM-dependent methyltransferase